jgi:hypothetical protein
MTRRGQPRGLAARRTPARRAGFRNTSGLVSSSMVEPVPMLFHLLKFRFQQVSECCMPFADCKRPGMKIIFNGKTRRLYTLREQGAQFRWLT